MQKSQIRLDLAGYYWLLYSMKIKEQTRKLAAGCSKHSFEVVDKTDEVSYLYLRQGDVDVV
ncbi:hypothetical protein [uncultured Streptococcus sp.]|uniref:hypothetical protein n=1 Tax=uncultured Streptococcus sp. TaxID=83427 RepID=UPI003211AF11